MSTMTNPINAKQVAELRARTGAGMMDCKKALEEAGGDMAKAEDLLRVKYAARADKRADRSAAEGAIEVYLHFNGRVLCNRATARTQPHADPQLAKVQRRRLRPALRAHRPEHVGVRFIAYEDRRKIGTHHRRQAYQGKAVHFHGMARGEERLRNLVNSLQLALPRVHGARAQFRSLRVSRHEVCIS